MDASCYAKEEGTLYFNPRSGATTSVPRHTEISDFLARKICRDLGIPAP